MKTKAQLESMSDDDWRATLDKESYHILREQGTEPPFSGKYTDETADGVYQCKGCGQALFLSEHKYHSGCGWPSFDAPIDGALTTTLDTSRGMRRIEVRCQRCDGHLGHVFADGPKETTGMRYCINSRALDLDKNKNT